MGPAAEVPVGVGEIVALVLPWAVVAFLAWMVTTLVRQHGQVLVRLDELGGRLAETERLLKQIEAKRETPTGAESPPTRRDPLARGAAAPSFRLVDLEGRPWALADAAGSPLVLVFFDVGCPHCRVMAPRLGELPADGARVVLVSRGDPGQLRALAAEHGWRCQVVLDQDWDVASAYGVHATPTGYLVDADRLASELAVGADAVLALTAMGLAPTKKQEAVERAHKAGVRARDTGESRIKRDGLSSGTTAPDFVLPDLAGEPRSLAEHRGTRVLLVFSDLDCGPCQELGPALVDLHRRTRGGNLDVLMISRGDSDANRIKAAEQGYEFPVLLQRSWEVSKDYAMFATPIAYLIDEEGVIAHDVAIGVPAILGLVPNA
jgi:peroxiredoxin